MTNIELKAKLEKTLNKLKETYKTINYGGCGYLAKELGDILKTKGCEVKYVLLLRSEDHIAPANKRIKQNRIDGLNMLDWAHVMLNVEDKLIDVDGLCEAEYDKSKKVFIKKNTYTKYYGVELPEQTLSEWLMPEYDSHWNYAFDRKIVPKMRKVLQKNLLVSK
jgi:hypothetical protein